MIYHMTSHVILEGGWKKSLAVWEREGQDYIIYLFVFLLEQQGCRMTQNQTATNITESHSAE